MSTKAEQTYERITALVAGGMKKAEAFKQLAAEYSQPVDSVRGAYYSVHSQTSTAPRRTRKRETTTQDAVASAIASLRGAIESIERETDAARERAVEAQREYEAMQAAAPSRIEEIQAKIAVLDPDAASPSDPVAVTEPTPTPAKRSRGKTTDKEDTPAS